MSSTRLRLPHSGALRRYGLTDSTYTAYYRATDIFLHNCSLTFKQLSTLDITTIDSYLSAWIEAEYEAGGSRSYAENTRNGLHFFCPCLKNQLHESHLRLKGWKRKVPGRSHPPLPRNIAVLMAASLARREHYHAALATLLSFDCYLRINECMKLRVGDVTIPIDTRLGARYSRCAVHLRTTKTLDNLSCTVRDPVIARLLHRCIIGRPSTDLVFPFTAAVYREHHFKYTLDLLGLGHLHFVPHSLRHGGATHDYVVVGRSEEHVFKRGRWASLKSANRYLQTLAAVNLTYLVPTELDQEGAEYDHELEFLMDFAIGEAWPLVPPLVSTDQRSI